MTEHNLLLQRRNESISVRLFLSSRRSIGYLTDLVAGSQLGLAKKYHLPLFLHSRAAHQDFVQILRDEGFGVDGGRAIGAKGGVVHSFTGLPEEAAELVRLLLRNSKTAILNSVPTLRSRWDFT